MSGAVRGEERGVGRQDCSGGGVRRDGHGERGRSGSARRLSRAGGPVQPWHRVIASPRKRSSAVPSGFICRRAPSPAADAWGQSRATLSWSVRGKPSRGRRRECPKRHCRLRAGESTFTSATLISSVAAVIDCRHLRSRLRQGTSVIVATTDNTAVPRPSSPEMGPNRRRVHEPRPPVISSDRHLPILAPTRDGRSPALNFQPPRRDYRSTSTKSRVQRPGRWHRESGYRTLNTVRVSFRGSAHANNAVVSSPDEASGAPW